jgi:hypothetical protein
MQPTTTDHALRRVQQSINRSAGQHKRAISEGTRSAQEILRRQPMTTDPLLLHRVHHVDTQRDLPPGAAGVAIGHAALQVDFATTAEQEAEQQRQAEPDETALGLFIVVATMTIFGAVIGYAIWSALQ